ncbi:hypothetical protein [Klebsiella sp. PL-2018]|uniref:hypothetical protein n=1 Tax=Klebsiella sp. PL-2018 TaxID=2851540 RepID=UPI001C217DB4|nr:hypothetical protein [Klebsiella sp. PL-2018]
MKGRTEQQGRHPGNDVARRAKRRCALRPGAFAGMRQAQVTARKGAATPLAESASLPLTSDIRH